MNRTDKLRAGLATVVILSVMTAGWLAVTHWVVPSNRRTQLPPLAHNAAPETITAAWKQAGVEERGAYLDHILRQSWPLNEPISPNPTLMDGMSQDEVILLLGKPDDESEHSISYELQGIRERSAIRDTATEAIMSDTNRDDLIIYFDETTGVINGIWVGS